MNTKRISCWIEAMRLRTLPVSTAGVVAAVALTIEFGCFRWLPSLICLAFAILAQIASNFANEYFDYRNGLDTPGRVGPRRGVTEGDIAPSAMLVAAIGTLAVAALLGCSLIWWGGWWLLLFGILIVLGALAYSAGPFPLSHHGLGEVAVILFFGIAPVTLTFYIMAGYVNIQAWATAVAMGLLGANVLIVNNYRDIDDDRAVGKRTLAVRCGRRAMQCLYLVNAIAAIVILTPVFPAPISMFWPWSAAILIVPLMFKAIVTRKGAALNPMLGATALFMLIIALSLLVSAIFFPSLTLI